jgi:hypothetical protein
MKYLDLILVLVSLAAAQNNQSNGAVNNPVTGGGRPTGVPTGSVLVSNGVLQPGVDQTKPVIDARDQGFVGNGSSDNTTAANTLLTAIGPTQTTIVFPAGTYVMGSVTFPFNVGLDFNQGAILSPSTGHTITIAGPILASPTRIFTNIASGQGAISLTGNRSLTRMSPLWFGLNCSGVGDNAPIWRQILAFTGDDSTFVLPQNCVDMHASTVNVSSRAGFKLISEDRAQNGGGNQRPEELWTGRSGGMWDFQANQAPTIEGFLFTNLSTAPVAFYLNFTGAPFTYISTEAWVQYNTFTNNETAPSGFTAVEFTPAGNGEKNVVDDNDFFCSQSRALNETHSGSVTDSSNVLTCAPLNCSFTTDATVGERVRVSYAGGIIDTTISSITDNNHLVMVATSSVNQTFALITFGQAYGTGISIESVNSKHNTLERDSFTQCQYGLNVTNGSFNAKHFGGTFNDVTANIGDISEPSELDYMETESSLQEVVTGSGSFDSPLTLRHLRNAIPNAISNGFIYFGAGGAFILESSELQETPYANAVVIGAAEPSNVNLTAIGNDWSPGSTTLATLGYGAWRTYAESGTAGSGVLISCGDSGISDAPSYGCYQFGEGGASIGTEGHLVVNSGHEANTPSFNTYTAEPVAGLSFVNEARGFQTNFAGGSNSTSMNFVGFDAAWSPNGGYRGRIRGGNSIGYRFTMPTVNSMAQPSSIGFLVNPPTANTLITNAYGVYVGDLARVTGITNRYSFYSAGATDTMFLAGFLNIGGQFTSTLATGTAPFSITSTTPVANLTASNHPQVYEAGVLKTAEKIYTNTQTLTAGAATHSFANSFTYTSSSTFGCTCTDQTAANACKAVPASATTVTLAGTGSDTLWLSCSGH